MRRAAGGLAARLMFAGWDRSVGGDGWGRLGELVDKPFDPGGEPVDLVGSGVDLVQQQPGQIAVVVVEAAVERLDQRRSLPVVA